jgi:hypothetical protein
MMAETLKQIEGIPETYPNVQPFVHRAERLDQDAVLKPELIWQRIEGYTAYRFTARQVVWIVEGEGQWVPPLSPANITASEVWENGGWVETTPPVSPLGGFDLPGDGPYRITAIVGDGTRRLTYHVANNASWRAPNDAAELVSIEKHTDGAWISDSITSQPNGSFDLSGGSYRITMDVPGLQVPECVQEAFRRLHEYSRGIAEQFRNDASYRKDGEIEVVNNWAGKALQVSGAADLLRPYRRAQ